MVRKVWNNDEGKMNPLEKVEGFLNRSKKALMMWSRQRRRGGERAIEEKTVRLQQLQAIECQQNVNEFRKEKEELSNLLEKEDLRWK